MARLVNVHVSQRSLTFRHVMIHKGRRGEQLSRLVLRSAVFGEEGHGFEGTVKLKGHVEPLHILGGVTEILGSGDRWGNACIRWRILGIEQ